MRRVSEIYLREGVEEDAGALQIRNVISSITRSFPYPPGALEIINRVTELVVAVNERPYLDQVSFWVEDILPEDV